MARQTKSKKSVNPSVTPETAFRVPLPYLWLILAIILLYAGSLKNGFTELDDTIFVLETREYNQDLSNIFHSFKRGVFHETNDTYYRPLLLNSFVLDHQWTGTRAYGYHLTNLLLHVLSVCLLFAWLKSHIGSSYPAFLLALLFALHPVLSQAVVWIPGRNDSLLAVFSLTTMLLAIRYLKRGSPVYLLMQLFGLLAALFTKETAVFLAPAFFVLLMTVQAESWKEKKMLMLAGSWILALALWLLVRSQATIHNDPLQVSTLITGFFGRSILAMQYLGKIMLPLNLSVFPMLDETSDLPGIMAILLLGMMLYFAKARNPMIILGGFAFYLILLFPAFLLPASLNNQDFEHRLYLPMMGLMLVINETVLFKTLKPQWTGLVTGVLVVILGVMNWQHQKHFKDPVSFWTAAVETTPRSSYANMMLAARLEKSEPARALEMMQKAYRLNPKEKYVNYYLGKMYVDRDSFLLAEKFLLDELRGSAYFETYFYLSRVAFEKKNATQSIVYMEEYLKRDPANPQAVNNYLLMLLQTNQKDKARTFIDRSRAAGIPVPQELAEQVK